MRSRNIVLVFVLALTTAFATQGLATTVGTLEQASDDVTLLMVEIQPDPPGDDLGEEWIEFANPTPRPLDLKGYFLTDGEACQVAGEGWVDGYHWPLNGTVPAQGRLVVDLPTTCIRLANTGDNVELLDEDGETLQNITYGPEGDLPVPGDGESLSACEHGLVVHGTFEIAPETREAPNQACETR